MVDAVGWRHEPVLRCGWHEHQQQRELVWHEYGNVEFDDAGAIGRRYRRQDEAGTPFCITVDTMANQYLPQIFGRGHYLVLDHINSLPNKLPEIYLKLRK